MDKNTGGAVASPDFSKIFSEKPSELGSMDQKRPPRVAFRLCDKS